jgi:hypothetical protein
VQTTSPIKIPNKRDAYDSVSNSTIFVTYGIDGARTRDLCRDRAAL